MTKFFAKNKLALTLVSLLAAGSLGVAAYIKYTQPTDTEGPTPQEQQTADDSPASTESTDTGKDKGATLEQSQQENQGSTAPAADFLLSLTRAGQSGAGQAVEIRAYVSGATAGSCTVSFSGPGSGFSKSSTITFDGRTYSCGALDAAASDFSQSGNWTYVLKATSGSKRSNTIEGQIEVKK